MLAHKYMHTSALAAHLCFVLRDDRANRPSAGLFVLTGGIYDNVHHIGHLTVVLSITLNPCPMKHDLIVIAELDKSNGSGCFVLCFDPSQLSWSPLLCLPFLP